MAIKRPRMNNNYSKTANLISFFLLIAIAGLIDNILFRILGIFIFSSIFEISYEIIFNKKEFLLVMNAIKDEKDIKQKLAGIIALLFIPLFTTILAVIFNLLIM
ncbi:hypothetical protein [Anaerocolumna xylanovorans]|uniref:Uncharacterized protein n=1 Tax=Anaerocolumna xylanovorans DSM 12503 TaxID=1121345 RepID=A0A1M7YNI3_9FIRM|nr:hypothetical protein [Anaerocolumna xylanovorans]SHO54223.1 hypothetical protein SAMN02745217_04680 [Anaerocolumna xylanovorans DSM 12503]